MRRTVERRAICRRPAFGDMWNMDSSTPAPRSRLGLLNAKFKECFKRNRAEMFPRARVEVSVTVDKNKAAIQDGARIGVPGWSSNSVCLAVDKVLSHIIVRYLLAGRTM